MTSQSRGLDKQELEALAERIEYNTDETQKFLQQWIDLLSRNITAQEQQRVELLNEMDKLKKEDDELTTKITEAELKTEDIDSSVADIQAHQDLLVQKVKNLTQLGNLLLQVQEAEKQIKFLEDGKKKIHNVAYSPFVLGGILKRFPASNLAEILQIDFPKILNTFFQLEVLNLKHFDLIIQDPQKAEKVANLLSLINDLHLSPTDLPGGSLLPLIPFFFNNIEKINASLAVLEDQNSDRLSDIEYDDLIREFLAEIIKVRIYKGREAEAREQFKNADGNYDEARAAEFTKYIHLFHSHSAANESAKYFAVMRALVKDLRQKEVFTPHLDKNFRPKELEKTSTDLFGFVDSDVEGVIYQRVTKKVADESPPVVEEVKDKDKAATQLATPDSAVSAASTPEIPASDATERKNPKVADPTEKDPKRRPGQTMFQPAPPPARQLSDTSGLNPKSKYRVLTKKHHR